MMLIHKIQSISTEESRIHAVVVGEELIFLLVSALGFTKKHNEKGRAAGTNTMLYDKLEKYGQMPTMGTNS